VKKWYRLSTLAKDSSAMQNGNVALQDNKTVKISQKTPARFRQYIPST
jgi:hypothetical protein